MNLLIIFALWSTGTASATSAPARNIYEAWRQVTFERVVKTRQTKRLSQIQVMAGRVLPRSALNTFENGLTSLSVPLAQILGESLEVSPQWLLAYDFLKAEVKDLDDPRLAHLNDVGESPFAEIVRMALASDVPPMASSPDRDCAKTLSVDVLIAELRRRGYEVRRTR